MPDSRARRRRTAAPAPYASWTTSAGGDAALAAALLADVWVVDAIDAVAPGFRGVAVTRDGRVWSPATRELRQVSAGGEDRVLSERNRREALVADVEAAAQRRALRAARRRGGPGAGRGGRRGAGRRRP